MASFFSTLFGGGAEREAADRNRGEIRTYRDNSLGAFDTGLNRSVGAVTDANNSAGRYLGNNYGLYGDLRATGYDILNNGRTDQINALSGAGAAYDPLADLGTKYGGASKMLLDSLGVNGAEGTTRAQAAFNAGPGFNFTLDTGLDALNRRRAAAGMLNSGNADIDALKFGTGLANQTYGDWQTRLGSFTPYELSATSGAASGRAGIGRDIAGVYGADTAARMGLESGVTQGQAGVNTARAANDVALGNTLSGLYTGDAGNRVGVYGNVLSGNTSANNMQAQGEASGARNLLGVGQQIANMAISAATGMPVGMGGGGGGGGSGGGSNWFSSMFSPQVSNGYNVSRTGGGNPFPTPVGGNAGATYGGWAY